MGSVGLRGGAIIGPGVEYDLDWEVVTAMVPSGLNNLSVKKNRDARILTFWAKDSPANGEKKGPRHKTVAMGSMMMRLKNKRIEPNLWVYEDAKPNSEVKYAQKMVKLMIPQQNPNMNIRTVYAVHPLWVMLTAVRGLG